MRKGYRNYLYIPYHHSCIDFLIINIPHQSGRFVTIVKPTLMHHCHPKSISYIIVHTWYRTLYESGQMYNDMCPSLWYYKKYIHCPKILCSAYSSLTLPPTTSKNWSFYYFRSFAFFIMLYSQNHTVHSFFKLTSFT